MPAKKLVPTKNIIEIVPININHDGRLREQLFEYNKEK